MIFHMLFQDLQGLQVTLKNLGSGHFSRQQIYSSGPRTLYLARPQKVGVKQRNMTIYLSMDLMLPVLKYKVLRDDKSTFFVLSKNKSIVARPAMAHTFIPRTQEADAGTSLSSRPDWSKSSSRKARETCLKNHKTQPNQKQNKATHPGHDGTCLFKKENKSIKTFEKIL